MIRRLHLSPSPTFEHSSFAMRHTKQSAYTEQPVKDKIHVFVLKTDFIFLSFKNFVRVFDFPLLFWYYEILAKSRHRPELSGFPVKFLKNRDTLLAVFCMLKLRNTTTENDLKAPACRSGRHYEIIGRSFKRSFFLEMPMSKC